MNIIGRTYVFNQEMHKHVLPITITKLEEVCFGIWFWHMFNYRFANQCKFCGVNLIGRSWRKGETNQISATYLRWYRPSLRDFIDNYVELELAKLLCLLMIIQVDVHWTRNICRLTSLFMFCWLQKVSKTVSRDKLWEHLWRLGIPLHLQQAVKTMYTIFYAKIQINSDIHGKEMSDISVKQGYPFFPHYLACTLTNLNFFGWDQ